MKKPFLKLVLLILFNLIVACFFPITSQGKVFVEPYLGMGKLQVTNLFEYKDISDGFLLGVRLGYYVYNRYSLGLEYQSGGPYRFGALLNRAEWNHRMMGLGMGADYDIVRFWLAYMLDNKIDDVGHGITYIGPAIKYGFGINPGGKLSVNLEITQHQINRIKQGSTLTDYTSYNILCTTFTFSIPIDGP